MKLQAIIIDDEPLAHKIINRYLAEVSSVEIKASFTKAMAGLEYLQQHQVDLVFLDINMPNLSGISLLKSLSHPPMVIFTTAYAEYAVEGFELEALDYLLKPFSLERFMKAIHKAIKKVESREHTPLIPIEQGPSNLIIKADRKLYPIPFDQILYLQAFGDYVKIFTLSKQYLPKDTLQRLQQQLPEEKFLRVHRSFVVSLSAIQYIEGNHLNIKDKKIPIGQSYKEILLKKLAQT